MSKDLIRHHAGKASGEYAGRHFIEIAGYMSTARAVLKEAGAAYMGSYLLPEGTAEATEMLIDEVAKAASIDNAQMLNDRKPVASDVAAKLKVGDEFDFGGTVGVKPITGFGMGFSARATSVHDARLAEFAGKEAVYVYNANAPAAKPVLTDEEKAAKKAETAARNAQLRKDREAAMTPEEKAARQAESDAIVAKRDMTRVIVVAGSVAEGGTVTVGGKDMTVSKLGSEFEISAEEVQAMQMRFPEAEGIAAGVTIQYANWTAPELEHEAPGI